MRDLRLRMLRTIVLLPSYALVLLVRALKWLIAPLAVVLQMLIGVPKLFLNLRQPLCPQFLPLQERSIPDSAWVDFTNDAEALAADGFIVIGDFWCDELVKNAKLSLRLLVQPDQGTYAISAHIGFQCDYLPAYSFVEFATRFSDGRVLVTNNLNLSYSLPAPKYQARLQLKDVRDTRALGLLHRRLVAGLPHTVDCASSADAQSAPMSVLNDSYAREMQALIEEGWLCVADEQQARLSWRGAWHGVWRQAWPLTALHLRNADRYARHLLAEYAIHADDFTGDTLSIIVDTQPLPPELGVVCGVWDQYAHVLALARSIDADTVLEAVLIDLAQDLNQNTVLSECRYSFYSLHIKSKRQLRRSRSFDVVLNPTAQTLAVTAMEQQFDQANDALEWHKMSAECMPQALRPEAGLRDLDTLLPEALQSLQLNVPTPLDREITVDSAMLYIDEMGIPRWQVAAWHGEDTLLHAEVNALL